MKRAILLCSSFVIALSACGGGSDAPPSPPPPPAQSLALDQSNAKPAARAAYGASGQSMGTGDYIGATGTTASPGGMQKPGPKPGGFPGVIGSVLQKTPVSQTVGCGPTGTTGTQTITYDFAVPGTLTAGDTIVVDANDCDEGLGEVINGRIEMTVAVFSGDLLVSGLYLMEMDVELIDFSVTTATDMVTSNGDSHVSIDTTGTPSILMSISGTRLETVSSTVTQTITGFVNAQSVNVSVQPEPYTLDASGSVDTSELAGAISYATEVTFQGAGDGYPFAGELLITGAGGSTVRLIALDAINVRIETDTDGDGNVDATEDTTWDDIAL